MAASFVDNGKNGWEFRRAQCLQVLKGSAPQHGVGFSGNDVFGKRGLWSEPYSKGSRL